MEPKVKFLGSSRRRRYCGGCRKDIIQALNEALHAANPKTILKQKIKLKGSDLIVDSVKLDLSRYERILVIGGGKASAGMSMAIERILGERITAGIVNIPDYLKPRPKSNRIGFHEATHPIPSSKGVNGV
ncbi:MAG: DUF4147 domain-containing protein, partial [Nitrososphaerales archaeon]